jgi:hypothetical protein
LPTYVQPSLGQQPAYTPNQQPAYTPNQQPALTPTGYTPQPPAYMPPQQPRKKSRRVLWIALSALIVVLLAGGGIFAALVLLPSTPTKTLDAFCSGIQSKNYQNAYNLLTVDYQAKNSEPTFKCE